MQRMAAVARGGSEQGSVQLCLRSRGGVRFWDKEGRSGGAEVVLGRRRRRNGGAQWLVGGRITEDAR